jgi:prophage DNA circulation protein
MYKDEAEEAAPIMQRALRELLGALPASSDPADVRKRADFRTACNSLIANAETIIQNDLAGEPLDNCFRLSVESGITLNGLRFIRRNTYAETAISVGARLIKNSIIHLTLAHAAQVLADMDFVSRDEVDDIKKLVKIAFDPAEEEAANDMDQMTYRALVELRAAVIFFLTETARPLPRMLAWQFSQVMSTLMLAQRLYYDASRADELRAENRIVHPAFSPRIGKALSA